LKAKVNPFYKKTTLNLRGKIIDLSTPKIMGILNITPDSFYDGGRYMEKDSILQQAEKMLKEGATLIDVGGYSSRPGAVDISIEEETDRLVGSIQAIREQFPDLLISADTFRAKVAEAAYNEGACMINDISAGELDPDMFSLIAGKNIAYALMHMRGTPQTMRNHTEYRDILSEMTNYFLEKLNFLKKNGVSDLIIDPGFGFAKSMDQNYDLLKNLNYFKALEVPILVGLSRKSMFYKFLGTNPQESLNATTAAHMVALKNGASILRVHDVKEASEAIQIFKLTEK